MRCVLFIVSMVILVCAIPAHSSQKYKFVDVLNGVVEYRVFPGDLNGAILLLHGNSSKKRWQEHAIDDETRLTSIASRLALDTGKAVIMPARPGFGNSTGARPGGKATVRSCTKKYVDVVCSSITEIIETEGLVDVTIVGYSAGAQFGATYALRHPRNVRKCVFYDGTYDVDLWTRLKGKKKNVETDTMDDLDDAMVSDVRFSILCGSKSAARVDPRVSAGFVKALRKKGFDVLFETVYGADHGGFMDNDDVYDVMLASIKGN